MFASNFDKLFDKLFDTLTGKTPHIDRCGVGQAQNNLWSPVESALNVAVNGLVFVARIAKVDHLDSARAFVFEENVFRFEVAVQNALVVEQLQALEYGGGEPLDQVQAEALVVVLAHQLVDVHAEQFERYADVSSKNEVVKHVNHVVLVVRIFVEQVPQYLDLAGRLLVKALLVSQHFQGDLSLLLVIEHLDDLWFLN